MPKNSITTRKLYTIFIALVFFAVPFGLPIPSAAAQATTPTLRIADASYVALPDGRFVFGDGQTVYVVITAPTADSTAGPDVVAGAIVKSFRSGRDCTATAPADFFDSTTATSNWKFDLLETGPTTGVFTGSFKVTSLVSSGTPPALSHANFGKIFGDGTVAVDPAGGKLCLSAAVPTTLGSSSTTTISDDVFWRKSNTATLAVKRDDRPPGEPLAAAGIINGFGRRLNFTVTDPDMHIVHGSTSAPETYSNLLRVRSDSDLEGEFVTLVESKTPNAPIADRLGDFFFGTIGFEPFPFANNGRIFVKHGDRVWAEFSEEADANGQARSTRLPTRVGQVDFWVFASTTDATATWGASPFFGHGVSLPSDPVYDNKLVAIVTDLDRSLGSTRADTIQVSVSTASDPFARQFVLVERGGLSGQFLGEIPFRDNTTATACSSNEVCVKHGDTVRMTYVDDSDAAGTRRVRTADTKFYRAETGVVTLGPILPPAAPSRILVGNAFYDVHVQDADLNRNALLQESVTVSIKSTTDPSSLTITLTETSENSGLFRGQVGFSETGATGRLRVTDRDQVVVHYQDAIRADDTPGRVSSNTVTWRAAFPARVFLDSPEYIKHLDPTANGNRFGPVATIMVEDHDRNDPLQLDSIAVSLVVPGQSSGVTVVANEAGIDSGLFVAQVEFGLGVGPGSVPRFNPGAASLVRAEYAETFNAAGVPAVVLSDESVYWDTATFTGTQSVMRYESSAAKSEQVTAFYHPDERGGLTSTVTVVVYNKTASSVTSGGSVRVRSTRCANDNQSPLVPLSRPDATSDRWTGTLTLTTAAGSGNNPCNSLLPQLGIAVGNTITQVGAPASAAAIVNPFSLQVAGKDRTGTVANPRVYGYEAAGYVWITGGPGNEHRAARDVIDVTLYNHTVRFGAAPPSEHITIKAVETDVNSGVFVASFGATPAATSNARVKAVPQTASVYTNALSTGTNGARIYDNVLEPTHLVAEVKLRGTGEANTYRGGLVWFPASEPTFTITDGFGTTVMPSVIVRDDRVQGFERHLIDATGASVYSVAGASWSPTYTAAYATVSGEALTTGGTHTLVSASVTADPQGIGDQKQPLADTNDDGMIDCADIVFTTSGGTGPFVCTSTPAELMQGILKYTDLCTVPGPVPGIGGCTATIAYRYRAIPAANAGVVETPTNDPQNDNQFHFRVVTPNQIQFGGSVPTGQKIIIETRSTSFGIQARSTVGGETLVVPLTLRTDGDYGGPIPLEFVAQGANANLFVRPGSVDHQDPIELTWNSQVLADGNPGSATTSHFRSRVATTRWFQTETAQVTFRTTDLSQPAASTFFGPYVPVMIQDIDRDLTGQPDTFTAQARNAATATDTVTVTFRETGPRTGVFIGVVPVNVGSAPEPNQWIDIAGAQGSIIVTREDPRGAAGTLANPSSIITWRPSGDGQVRLFGSDAFAGTPKTSVKVNGTNEALYVRVIDADANENPLLRESLQVRVSTPSMPQGMLVTLLERSADSSEFRSAGIRFGPTASADRVLAVDAAGDGEEVRVVYFDPKNAQGVAQAFEPSTTVASTEVAQFANWDRKFDGVVSMDRPFFIGVTPNSANTATDKALVNVGVAYVRDGDLNTLPGTVERYASKIRLERISPELGTPDDATDVQVSLIETGANTGVFFGRFAFSLANSETAEVIGSGPTLYGTTGAVGVTTSPPETQIIRAGYSDDVDSRGVAAEFTAERPWFRAGVGAVRFDRESYTDLANTPIITLHDGQLDTTSAKDKVTVRVNSQASPTVLNVELEETEVNSGIFRRAISLTSGTTSGTAIKVATTDTLEVAYTDASPSGVRTHTVPIRIGDRTAPTTAIRTIPATADGANGVFKTPIQVTFDPNELVKKTFYRLNGSDPVEWNGAPIPLGHGVHAFRAWSIDLADNDEASNPAIREILVDLTPVTITPTNLVGTAAVAGSVRLTWNDTVVRTDPLEFFEYLVYRDGGDVPIGNATTNLFVDRTLTNENPRTYRVAISDKAGNVGPRSGSVSVTPDATLPTLSAPFISPVGFDTRAKPAGITVRADATDLNLAGVKATLFKPSGEAIVQANLALVSGKTYSAVLSVTAIDQPCECRFNVTAFDRAGNERSANFTYKITGPDTEMPQASLSSSSILLGSPLTVTVSDNVALTKVQYRLDSGPTVVVNVVGRPQTVSFEVPASVLAIGAHTITIEAEDNATTETGAPIPNRATITLNFTVVAEGGGAPPASFFLPTTVSVRSDGSIAVAWDVPSSVTGVAGFQVWRSSSPFALVGNVTNPSQRTFVDSSAAAGTVYRYVVTFYTATPFLSLGQVPGYTSDDAVPASAPVQRASQGLPSWLWVVVGVGAFIVVAVLIAVMFGTRRSAGQQTVSTQQPPQVEEEQPPRAAMIDTHRLRCPQCSHRFEVSGTKPIVTNCPNCGRKGILR